MAAPWMLACSGGEGGAAGAEDQSEARGQFSTGNVSELSVGIPQLVSGQPIILVRDAQGVYAMSTICSHRFCDMSKNGDISAAGLSCTCHGSEFDLEGNPLAGPARGVLVHFAVQIDASGNITIDADQRVDASVRAPVT